MVEVFRRALAVAGPDRLLFGTDSSYFPRGWRQTIHGAQRTILDEIGTEPEVSRRIFSGNFDRLFPPVA
jgi:predicted TIM-barrel fold metal-dependent hydrolase